jgi:hypothetical protein
LLFPDGDQRPDCFQILLGNEKWQSMFDNWRERGMQFLTPQSVVFGGIYFEAFDVCVFKSRVIGLSRELWLRVPNKHLPTSRTSESAVARGLTPLGFASSRSYKYIRRCVLLGCAVLTCISVRSMFDRIEASDDTHFRVDAKLLTNRLRHRHDRVGPFKFKINDSIAYRGSFRDVCTPFVCDYTNF